jgi:ribosomal-protein-alanine N-acetyltransferase
MGQSSDKNTIAANIRLRPMQEADLRNVHRLEVMCQPFPWPLWCFRSLLRKDTSCWVLEKDNEVIGFGIVSFVKDWAHIMNMCVAPGFRRRGLGRRIMLHLLNIAKQRHCKKAFLEVRPTNRTAIILYRKLGFRTKQIRKNYYLAPRGRQNGLVMARPLHLHK